MGATFSCIYDENLSQIDYDVIGGGDSITYTVAGGTSGAVAAKIAFSDLTTNSHGKANASTVLSCSRKGSGSVTLTFRLGTQVLYTCKTCFQCNPGNSVPKEINC